MLEGVDERNEDTFFSGKKRQDSSVGKALDRKAGLMRVPFIGAVRDFPHRVNVQFTLDWTALVCSQHLYQHLCAR